MNRKALFLVLLALVFAGYLLLEFGGGANSTLVEEAASGSAAAQAGASEQEPDESHEVERAARSARELGLNAPDPDPLTRSPEQLNPRTS